MTAQLLWIVVTCSAVADALSFSSFAKTTITNTECERINELQTTQVRNTMECSMKCSGNLDCRRFRYCSSDSICVLYLDGTHCEMRNILAGCSCYRKVIGCRESECTCPLGYYGNNCENIVKDCKEASNRNVGGLPPPDPALVYIKPNSGHRPKEVTCMLSHGGGLIILSRTAYCYSENFNRTMVEYEHGFGLARLNRWIGLKTIKAVMRARPSTVFQLQVMLFDPSYTLCLSYYDDFQIGTDYSLGYSVFSPGSFNTCGDALNSQLGFRFSTYDDDLTPKHCASKLGGGWWFNNGPNCSTAFLTGTTGTGHTGNIWHETFRDKRIEKAIMTLWVA